MYLRYGQETSVLYPIGYVKAFIPKSFFFFSAFPCWLSMQDFMYFKLRASGLRLICSIKLDDRKASNL